MVHGIVYLLFATELVWMMSASPLILAPFAYPALSFLVAGVGFLAGKPEVFGKQPDGRFQRALFILHLPYHSVGLLSVWVRRLRDTHRPFDEIADGLWLGERTKILPDGVELIVDLTAEHSRIDIPIKNYLLVATLDGQAPGLGAMVAAIEQIESSPQETYVHCWAGKGRSATLVAGVLIVRGLATNADDAEHYMQARRPIVKLSKSQRKVVNDYASYVERNVSRAAGETS